MQLIHIATKIAILQPNIGVRTGLDPSSCNQAGPNLDGKRTIKIESVISLFIMKPTIATCNIFYIKVIIFEELLFKYENI